MDSKTKARSQRLLKSSEIKSEIPSNAEVGRSVDYLIAYRLEIAKNLLANAELPVSGNKSDLRKRILTALADDKISPSEVISRLDDVEGWGNQHIVLFKSTEPLASTWQDEKNVQAKLKSAGLDSLLNRPRPIALPEEPTLSQIMWSEESMRLTWVHGSQWQMRVAELDYPRFDGQTSPHKAISTNAMAAEIGNDDESIIYKAYQIQQRRQVCYFDWDLVTCEAALMMPRLPSDGEYEELQTKLLSDAEHILEMTSFETLQLNKLIRNLERANEVSRRDILLTTTKRTEINIRSADRKTDAYTDPAASDARNAVKNRAVGTRGQFYWLPDGNLIDRTIQMRVYPGKQRISIHDQCTEAEVRHVLSRVRQHCR